MSFWRLPFSVKPTGVARDSRKRALSRRAATSGSVLLVALLCLIITAGCAERSRPTAQPQAGERAANRYPADTRFRAEAHDFIESELRLSPVWATTQGDHRYDAMVDDLSSGGIAHRILHATNWKRNFEAFIPEQLSPHNRADCQWLIAQADGELLWNEQIRQFERDPEMYLPTSAIYSLVQRNFAPAEVRMRSVTAREIAALSNLAAARDNLTAARTPPVAIEIVLADMPATIAFFKNDLPKAFASVPDGPDKAAFEKANARLVAALEDYARWLKGYLMPRARGSYAIGKSAYQRMLADDDMVNVPLVQLEALGEQELVTVQMQFDRTAHEIDPSRTPAEVAAMVNREHPAADKVVPEVKAGLAALRAFVIAHRIVAIPPGPEPLVRETPPFMRATTFASMDTPGPFEKSAEAYFYVTLPDPSWTAARREQLLEFFSPPLISDLSVHEVYPGHYVQFLNNRRNPDLVRSLYYSGANVEGWAFYCEQMMLDEGLHRGKPRYRLAMLQLALLRACRYLVGIRMHTEGMTVAQAIAFFEKNAYMTPNNARAEALRGTEDPGYLRYQLGKLMILKLRDDLRRKQGPAFSLEKFHGDFLAEGGLPIPLIRRALLGTEGSPL